MVVSDEEIIERLREEDDPVLTAKEVAEGLPITKQATGRRLNDLVEEDRIARKMAGPSVVYWLPDD